MRRSFIKSERNVWALDFSNGDELKLPLAIRFARLDPGSYIATLTGAYSANMNVYIKVVCKSPETDQVVANSSVLLTKVSFSINDNCPVQEISLTASSGTGQDVQLVIQQSG